MQRSKRTRVLAALGLKKIPKADWDHSLPVELLEEIFAQALDGYPDSNTPMTDRRKTVQPLLRNLTCVCQVWYSMITPMLYREIYISSSDALASLARAVTKHPHLQLLVHSFYFCSVMFRSARIDISEADAWNLKRIYRACPNLYALTTQRRIDFVLASGGPNLKSMGLDEAALEKLTRLKIELPHGIPCSSKLLFTSDVSLPNLQELILVVKPKEIFPDKIYPAQYREHTMEWPRMPKLTRLCIKNWHVQHACFTFPEHSDKLRIIELLGGNYSSITGFWYRDLQRYASTLESLTITAVHISSDHDYIVDFKDFRSLTELCLPLSAFGKWQLCWLPFPLQRLILAGCPEKGFDERDNFLLRDVEKKLGNLLELKHRSGTMKDLKLIRVMVESIWMWRLGPVFKFEKATKYAQASGVKLVFGFLEGEENTFTENMKEKLFDKFPLLERKLQ